MSRVVSTQLGEAVLVKLLGKGKSGYSYLAELNGQHVVFKHMHDEPCSYYTFSDNKVKLEVGAYQVLTNAAIPVPELLCYDFEKQYLVKNYMDGTSGHEWLAQGNKDESVIKQLFLMSARLKLHNLNIDYFPPNFVISQGKLWYVDYEVNPFMPEWSLEQWGIYYWANSNGMAEFVNHGNWSAINQKVDSGVPIKEPFEEQVRLWKNKFGAEK